MSLANATVGPPPSGNHLLRTMSAADLDLLAPHMEVMPLIKDHVIFQPGEPATHVWFPNRGMVSIVVGQDDGAAIEVATVGREGMTGVPVVLGGETMIYTAMVQVPGDGWRIDAAVFRRLVAQSRTMQATLLHYVLAIISQIGQNAACAHRHGLEARCARWLLLAHDDVDGDSFPLTQDYLAMMLGVTRPSVSNTASALQRAGLIRYVRGQMTIIDRAGLEAAACDCYDIVRAEFQRLLPA